jgi:hypothetical protein
MTRPKWQMIAARRSVQELAGDMDTGAAKFAVHERLVADDYGRW